MSQDRCNEFTQSQRYNQFEIVGPTHINVLSDAPHIEEDLRVHCDGQELDHGYCHRIWEVTEQHFANNIVARAHNIPQQTQDHNTEDFSCLSHFLLCWHLRLKDALFYYLGS